MSRSLPPLTWFRAFEAAARHLSFTAAAQELGLTQSAVSQHVRSLELRFGQMLFARKPRGLALTDAGRRLLPAVAKAIGGLAEASALFEPARPDSLLTVATSVSFSQWFLAPDLGEFLEDNPGARIRVTSAIWPDDFHASQADVEIRFGSRDLVGDGAEQLRPDDLTPVCAPALGCAIVSWEDLRAQRLIQTVGTSDPWEGWAQSLGLMAPPPATLFVDSYGFAVDLARSGAGVALVSRLLALPELAAGRLVAPLPLSAPGREGYFIAVKSADGREDGLARRFERWLRARIAACAVATAQP